MSKARDSVEDLKTLDANLAAKLPKSGGALTGAVTTNSTFDGVDVGVRDGVLTSTTAAANAALPKAGGTMTGVIAGFESTGIDDNATSTAITIGSDETITLNATGGSNYTSAASKVLRTAATQHTILSVETSSTSGHQAALELESNGNPVVITTTGSNEMTFKTNAAERMRIDSLGNVLVGTANIYAGIGNTDTGHSLGASGYAAHSRNSLASLYLNRNTSDGEILRLQRQGVAVGSIAVATDINIGSGATRVWFRDSTKTLRPVSTEIGNGSDGIISLGEVGGRFKDAYLSGGVYLGGTGAANKLSDYETGTFTPYIGTWTGTAPTTTAGTFKGSYTKIGRSVTCQIEIDNLSLSGTTSGLFVIKGLPFTPRTAVDQSGSIGPIHRFNFARNDHKGIRFINNVGLAILSSQNNGGWDWETNSIVMGSSYINCSITYFTDS